MAEAAAAPPQAQTQAPAQALPGLAEAVDAGLQDRAALEHRALQMQAEALQQGNHAEAMGAPMTVRFLVGLAKSPQDMLATLQNYQAKHGVQPDAEWVTVPGSPVNEQWRGRDPHEGAAKENEHTTLIYTDPTSGKRTLVNPPGLDPGDLVAHSRDLARTIAFAGGAAAGGAFLPGGQATGAVTGMAADQGLDEFIDRVLGPKLGVVDSRQEGQKWLDRGADVAREGGTLLAFGAGGKALGALSEVGTPGSGGLGPGLARLRPGLRGAAGSGQQEVADAAQTLGMETRDVPAAVLSKSRSVQGMSEAALKSPYTNDVTQPVYDRFMQRIRAAWDKTVPAAAGTGAAEVRKDVSGAGIKAGLGTWNDAVKADIGRAEATMDHLMFGEAPDAEPLATFARDTIDRYGAGSKVPQEYKRVISMVEKYKGNPPWDVMRQARTDVGNALDGADAQQRYWLAPLYKKYTEALEQSANSAGGQMPKLWQQTMALERQQAKDWGEVQQLAQQVDETAHNMLAGSAQQGPSLLKAVRAKVPEDKWNAAVSTMLRDKAMVTRNQGENAAGLQMEPVYSPTALAKTVRDLKKSGAYDVMAPPGSALRKAIDAHATIGAAMEQSQVMRNFSRTATGIKYNEMLEGGAGAGGVADAASGAARGEPIQATVGKAANYGLNKAVDAFRMANARAQAKLLADPEFGKWMLQSRSVQAADPSAWSAHLNRLTAVAEAKPGIRSEIGDYLGIMRDQEAQQQGQEPPPPPAGGARSALESDAEAMQARMRERARAKPPTKKD